MSNNIVFQFPAKDKVLTAKQVPVVYETTELKLPENTHHIWIRDRSGSMSGVMRGLLNDLYERIKQLPVGDIISIGWFSSRNQFNWDIVGFKITDSEKDFLFLKEQLFQNSSTLGLTCYSDILVDAKSTVIKKYNSLVNNFSLMFLTDGYPNVDSEVEIFNAVNELKPLVSTALIVGYGNYYNKELLAEMASRLGGGLTHSQDLSQFSIQLKEFVENVSDNGGKTLVEVPSSASLVYTVQNKQIIQLLPDMVDGKNVVSISRSKRNRDYVFYVTSTTVEEGKTVVESDLTEDLISNRRSPIEPIVKGLYGYAYLMSLRTKVAEALEVLGFLGDVYLIDKLYNAFTPAEYGLVEAEIRNAVGGASKRFLSGHDKSFLPKEDAYCLVELLEDLQLDDTAVFYPYHPDWKYNRIGVKSVYSEGYPEFKANENPKIPFNTLIWNKEFLNLSVLGRIDGKVKFINEDYKKFGFGEEFPSHIFRNYSLVKDGFLNVENLFVSLHPNLIQYLQKKNPNLVASTSTPNVFELRLTEIPVINRKIGSDKTSAKVLFEQAWEELKLQANLKVLNNEIDRLEEVVKKPSLLTEEQQSFLESQGINYNGFNPPVTKLEPTDFYEAKEFSIKISGFSSIPSLKTVFEKEEKIKNWNGSGKQPKFTPSEALIKKYIDEVNLYRVEDKALFLKSLEVMVDTFKKRLIKVRSNIQKIKFSVLLGKLWFDEFNTRDESSMTLQLDGEDVTFNLTIRNVKIDV